MKKTYNFYLDQKNEFIHDEGQKLNRSETVQMLITKKQPS